MLLLVSLCRVKDFGGITVSAVSLAACLLLSVALPPLLRPLPLSLPQYLAAAVLCSAWSSVLSWELSDWELCPRVGPPYPTLIMRIQGQTQASPIPELQPAHFE